jgi:hypothetical protein
MGGSRDGGYAASSTTLLSRLRRALRARLAPAAFVLAVAVSRETQAKRVMVILTHAVQRRGYRNGGYAASSTDIASRLRRARSARLETDVRLPVRGRSTRFT